MLLPLSRPGQITAGQGGIVLSNVTFDGVAGDA